MTVHTISNRLLILGMLAALLLPVAAGAEFYSYEDSSGTLHFVDDPARIPQEYRQKKQVRKDRYDDLPAEEQARMLEFEQRERAESRRNEAEQQERLRRSRADGERRAALEQQRLALITPVIIAGRQVFVPVKLANGGAETEALLLLDTGATSTVISPEVAARLKIQQADNVRVSVVGGRVLNVKRAVIGQIRVGPVQRGDQEVIIVNQRGSGMGDGLLGMSFLAGLKYTIDFHQSDHQLDSVGRLPMLRLILLGMLSAVFFSSTFVLNRAMSLEGGHWVWTASLRFGFMLVFLSVYILCTRGRKRLAETMAVFLQFRLFWIAAGSIGFGVFYALLSFSSAYAPGWIIATTWQATILATPVVLFAFGKRVPFRGVLLTGIIFSGIMLVNIEYGATTTIRDVFLGVIPVLVAAFAYPLGNQMVWEATQRGYKLIPHIDHAVMQDSFARVLLLTMGSMPFWLVLVLWAAPPPPTSGQLFSTAMVALFSGVIATTIFLYARHLCVHSYEIAAVDATQSMEVVFSLVGEILFLRGVFPGIIGVAGIALTIIGLVAYTRQHYAPQGAEGNIA